MLGQRIASLRFRPRAGRRQGAPRRDHPDDPEPPARRLRRDRPPSPGDAEHESHRSDEDICAVANEEADQRGGEEQDREQRDGGQESFANVKVRLDLGTAGRPAVGVQR